MNAQLWRDVRSAAKRAVVAPLFMEVGDAVNGDPLLREAAAWGRGKAPLLPRSQQHPLDQACCWGGGAEASYLKM